MKYSDDYEYERETDSFLKLMTICVDWIPTGLMIITILKLLDNFFGWAEGKLRAATNCKEGGEARR